jgi:hypothetical protein
MTIEAAPESSPDRESNIIPVAFSGTTRPNRNEAPSDSPESERDPLLQALRRRQAQLKGLKVIEGGEPSPIQLSERFETALSGLPDPDYLLNFGLL